MYSYIDYSIDKDRFTCFISKKGNGIIVAIREIITGQTMKSKSHREVFF